MFLLEAVAQDHRIVKAQRKLQNAGDGIGHEGDLSQQEVGALIQDHRCDKGQQQHRHFTIGTGSQNEYGHHNNRHIDHDNIDFGVDGLCQRVAQFCRNIDVII